MAFGFPSFIEQDPGNTTTPCDWALLRLGNTLRTALTEIDGGYTPSIHEFNTLRTSTEYMLNLLRFLLHDPNQLGMVNFRAMNHVQELVRKLKEKQRCGNRLEGNIAQSDCIEGCFTDIFSALKQCEEQREGGASIGTVSYGLLLYMNI